MELVHCKELLQVNQPSVSSPLVSLIEAFWFGSHGSMACRGLKLSIEKLHLCRKRCMDLVSFESEEEWKLVKSFMDGAGIKEIWTSGRLCDAEVMFVSKNCKVQILAVFAKYLRNYIFGKSR